MRRPRDALAAGGQAGSAAVEFALVLPLVLVLVLALVQVGLIARDRLLVEAAARAGARDKFSPLTCAPGSEAHTRCALSGYCLVRRPEAEV